VSFFHKLFGKLTSPGTMAKMEADSRLWMVRCDKCGYEKSVWEMGGIRYKAHGNPRWLMKCIQCGQRSWHKVYKKEG
jgi:ribosomal protein S27E